MDTIQIRRIGQMGWTGIVGEGKPGGTGFQPVMLRHRNIGIFLVILYREVSFTLVARKFKCVGHGCRPEGKLHGL